MAPIEINSTLTRRRFMTLSAAVAGICLTAARAGAVAVEPVEWRGRALGAEAELILYHPDRVEAERIVRRVVAQVRRLEGLFSLFEGQSMLLTLNRTGVLEAPAPEFVDLLAHAERYHRLSDGLFDPSVQPLWQLYASHFNQPGAPENGPDEEALAAARSRIGFEHVAFNRDRVAFMKPGMGLTFNGIAQGYITDRAVELLRSHGITQSLVDFGEIRAMGSRRDGSPWQVGVENPEQRGAVKVTYPLADRAIATSGGYGFRFGGGGSCNHIFDPRTGHCSSRYGSVSIIHQSATAADALATAACLMNEADISQMLAGSGGGEAWILTHAGELATLTC